mmetsp:Transcript_108620/g.324804  ORF Transcript_108620/g.324804 Transcript_108620/m.324804 type:complete len:859 (-) Transcript_108620:486-3062(-)
MQGQGRPGTANLDHERLNHIEEIILAKVQQRTPQRMNEDTYMVKAFRYHDLSNAGFCDFEGFKRALGPFTSGITEQDLASIFGRYSPQGPLNYKIFAAEFVDGVRRQPELLPDPGQDAGETAQEVLLGMKASLYGRGPRAVVGLATAFQDADPQNSRTVPFGAFRAVVSDAFGGELREEQADLVFDLFRLPYAPDHMAYDELLVALQDGLSPERRESVRAVFRRLDANSEGLVDAAHAVRSFNAGRHPFVSDGQRQPEDLHEEFRDTLRDAVAFRRGQPCQPTGLVAWEEFEDYYKLVSGCYADDALFCGALQRVFDLDKAPNHSIDAREVLARPAAGIPPKSRAGLHHWQSNTLPTNPTHHNVRACAEADDIFARLRQQVARRGLRAAVGVVESFYSADDDVDDVLDAYDFRRACQQAGFSLRGVEESAVFEACGADPGGKQVSLPLFLRHLHGGPLGGTRRAAVERAFAALGGDPRDEAATVSPGVLKGRFAADAHPLVARGEMESAAATAEFLDTFSLLAHVRGGCQDGMVAFSDFLAYYEVVSSTVDSDAFFELLLDRLWSPPPSGEQGGGPGASNGFAKSLGSSSPMREPRPPAHSGPSAYQRPGPGLEDSPSRLDVHRRFLRKEAGGGDEAASPPPAAFSAITKSSIVFDEEGAGGELGLVLRRFREGLAKRGIKGWRSLAQRFQQHDNRKNGTVMRLDWERLHRMLGLGLSPEDRELLFRAFSAGRRDGAMDYRECLRRLCGPMPEQRQVLVERLFDSLRQGAEVSAEALKAGFDAPNSPPCLLGRANPAQVAQDFGEAVDFFGGGRGFDEARFAELFRVLSALHPEEDEFRLMATAAFGLAAAGGGQEGA